MALEALEAGAYRRRQFRIRSVGGEAKGPSPGTSVSRAKSDVTGKRGITLQNADAFGDVDFQLARWTVGRELDAVKEEPGQCEG